MDRRFFRTVQWRMLLISHPKNQSLPCQPHCAGQPSALGYHPRGWYETCLGQVRWGFYGYEWQKQSSIPFHGSTNPYIYIIRNRLMNIPLYGNIKPMIWPWQILAVAQIEVYTQWCSPLVKWSSLGVSRAAANGIVVICCEVLFTQITESKPGNTWRSWTSGKLHQDVVVMHWINCSSELRKLLWL